MAGLPPVGVEQIGVGDFGGEFGQVVASGKVTQGAEE
jgi:hypothetical protein